MGWTLGGCQGRRRGIALAIAATTAACGTTPDLELDRALERVRSLASLSPRTPSVAVRVEGLDPASTAPPTASDEPRAEAPLEAILDPREAERESVPFEGVSTALAQLEAPPVVGQVSSPDGAAAILDLNERWSVLLSAGFDRLEEDVEATDIGWSDTFVTLSWQYGLSERSALVWCLAGLRTQDESLTVALEDTEFAWGVVGLQFRF
jgi:hypothetical protein